MGIAFVSLVVSALLEASGPDCEAVNARANEAGIRIPGHSAIYEVVGHGRLQFYSGPSAACVVPGVFIVRKDRVIAYVEYGGYTFVLFTNSKEGGEALGWVRTERLRATGEGISPR
jgi:hypothetical protein